MAEEWTKEEVVGEAARIRDLVRRMFVEKGSFRTVTYLYASRNPETGEASKGLVLVPVFGGFGPREKDFYAQMLRLAAQKVGATGVVFASEVWVVDPEFLKGMTAEEALADYRKYKNLEEHPRRIECLHVTLEHHRLTGMIAWHARITRDADNKPTLGEWEEQLWDGKRVGRFTDVLPAVN